MPTWIKSKFFWLNLLAIIALIIEYFIDNNLFTNYIAWEGLALVVINAISGMISSSENKAVKSENIALKAQVAALNGKVPEKIEPKG